MRYFWAYFACHMGGSALVLAVAALAWWLFGDVASIIALVVTFAALIPVLVKLLDHFLDRENEAMTKRVRRELDR